MHGARLDMDALHGPSRVCYMWSGWCGAQAWSLAFSECSVFCTAFSSRIETGDQAAVTSVYERSGELPSLRAEQENLQAEGARALSYPRELARVYLTKCCCSLCHSYQPHRQTDIVRRSLYLPSLASL